MIPQIGNIDITQIQIVRQPSFTYRVTERRIMGDIDGVEALAQAIMHRVLTERYAYPIYSENYGTELQQYIGQDFGYLEATIENTLRYSLMQDDRITSISIISVEKTESDSALITFTVNSIYGTIENEVTINV